MDIDKIVEQPQTVISLETQNVKGIKAIRIEPRNGEPVIIGGNNGQGKSSTLDSIHYALSGKKALPEQPIRAGETKAHVIVETEDLLIKRTFSQKGSNLSISYKNGGKITAPQSIADALCGRLAFDPLEFAKMLAPKQAELLRELSGLDLSEIDQKIKWNYEQRTFVNHEYKQLKAKFDTLEYFSQSPDMETPTQEVLNELDLAKKQNQAYVTKEQEIHDLHHLNMNNENRIKELLSEIEILNDEIEINKDQIDQHKLILENFESIDENKILEKLSNLEETNKRARSNREYKITSSELKRKQVNTENLTDTIAKLREERSAKIAAANMPIDGLEIDMDGLVTFDKIPLSQCSTAEILKISASIGFALNPRFRVLIIREGSALDDDNRALLAQMAKEKGAQLWIECVGNASKLDAGAIVIEDGEIKEIVSA